MAIFIRLLGLMCRGAQHWTDFVVRNAVRNYQEGSSRATWPLAGSREPGPARAALTSSDGRASLLAGGTGAEAAAGSGASRLVDAARPPRRWLEPIVEPWPAQAEAAAQRVAARRFARRRGWQLAVSVHAAHLGARVRHGEKEVAWRGRAASPARLRAVWVQRCPGCP